MSTGQSKSAKAQLKNSVLGQVEKELRYII